MEAQKEGERILIIGATGYFGRRLVKACLAVGHPTFLLFRLENSSDRDRCQMLMDFKMQGATLLQGSLDDLGSLVSSLKQVDIVVCAIAGDCVLEQLKLVEAIKEAGNIKRFLPTEFGMDADRMKHAIPPGDQILKNKLIIRQAIEKANIPHTYISANCFAGIFLAGLAQLGTFMPPRDRVCIYGNGDKKCVWVDENDAATYSILTASDSRALNKIVYIRPPRNILSQMEIVKIWEKLIQKELKKTFVPSDEWVSMLDKDELPIYEKIAVAHLYQIFYVGDLDFDVDGPNYLETNELYPEYKYVTAEEYLKRFL